MECVRACVSDLSLFFYDIARAVVSLVRWRRRDSRMTARYELQYTATNNAKRMTAVGTLIETAITSSLLLLPSGVEGGGCTGAFTVGEEGDWGDGMGDGDGS
tara:strand:- start:334 stop:639 length:306 start_codon:yes stop_codon:yes gene_type:complete